MNYNESKTRFDAYVEQCRQDIIKHFFPNENNLLQPNNIIMQNNTFNTNATEEEKQKRKVVEKRLKMIKQKLDHTMRMIEEIIRINEQMGIKLDFQLVMKIAILYHDIGRFEQATWSDNFKDSNYNANNKKYNGEKVSNHGQAGKHIFLNNDFAVDEQYAPIVGESIFYHVNPENYSNVQHHYENIGEIRGLNIKEIATGHTAENLNEAEWHIVSLITQLVADIDKVDILYQYLTGEEKVFKPHVVDDSKRSLDEISLDWGIPKSEILQYNNIEEEDYNKMTNKEVKIPVENLELSKLEVSDEFRKMFYEFCTTDTKEIKEIWGKLPILWDIYPKWSFVYVIWWRISKFIKDINFYSVLVGVEECKLLEQIYEQMPEKYRSLIREPIDYALSKLIPEKKGNEQGLYTRK